MTGSPDSSGPEGEAVTGSGDTWPGVMNLNQTGIQKAALMYAKAGIKIFPAYEVDQDDSGKMVCACQNGPDCDRPGKHPRIKGWKELATCDVAQIRQWWSQWPSANIAMPTGATTGFVAIDLDVREYEIPGPDGRVDIREVDGADELELWLENAMGIGWGVDKLNTLTMRTGGGGRQLIMSDSTADLIRSVPGWLAQVDIRGRDGLTILPPSTHKSGNKYAWLNESAPKPLPGRLKNGLINAKGSVGSKPKSLPGAGGSEVGHVGLPVGRDGYDYRKAIAEGPPLGVRDDLFNRYAFELRKTGHDVKYATDELRRVWELTPGGGAVAVGADPYRWETVAEKISRIWESVVPDPQGRPIEPVANELIQWAEGAAKGIAVKVPDPQAEEISVADLPPIPDKLTPNDPGAGTPSPVVIEGDRSREVASDLGNASRFGRLFGERIKHVSNRGWFLWDGSHWESDELNNDHMWAVVNDIHRQALACTEDEDKKKWAKWAHDTQGSGHLASINKLSATDPRILLKSKDLDSNPWYMAVRNGTINLRNGELMKGPVDDYCTRVGGTDFDPSATATEWDQHIRLITSHSDGTPDPELAGFLQRWAGYSLTGLVKEQKFTFCYGDGANGKNVFLEALMKVMGSYATSASQQLLTGNGQEHPTILADLAGPRLVFVDETIKGKINEGRLKQITGSEYLKARTMGKDFFEFQARFKLWIAGNNKPRVTDTSGGFWRRLDLIPFDTVIPAEKRIKDYARLLYEKEGPGILNWALEGLMNYQEVGLRAPSRVDDAREEYREEEDVVGRFLSDTFDMTSDHRTWVPNSVIAGLHQAWSSMPNKPNMIRMAADLKKHGITKGDKKRRVKVSPYGISKPEWGWLMPPFLAELPTELIWTT